VRGPRFAAANVLDGNPDTYWSTPDAVKTPSLVLDLPPGRRFDLIRIREALALGVRVTKFAIDVADANGAWREVAVHECIGAQRIIRLPAPVTARRVRLRIVDAPACPAITELSLFLSVAPVAVAASQATGNKIIAKTGWTIAGATQHTLGSKSGKPDFSGETSLAGALKPALPGAEAVLDDDLATVWTTPAPTPTSVVMLMIDMGRAEQVAGFSLTPTRQALPDAGPPGRYRVETSEDGKTWTPAGEGEFGNIAYARATQRITFAKPRQARYLMLGFTSVATGQPKMAIAGIGAFRP